MTKRTLINTAHCILCCLTIFAGASAGAATLGGPMTLEDEGSFFVNGKIVDSDFPGASLVTGPSPPGRIMVNQMYVHFRIPASKRGPPDRRHKPAFLCARNKWPSLRVRRVSFRTSCRCE